MKECVASRVIPIIGEVCRGVVCCLLPVSIVVGQPRNDEKGKRSYTVPTLCIGFSNIGWLSAHWPRVMEANRGGGLVFSK
jgi:hypothetical protein